MFLPSLFFVSEYNGNHQKLVDFGLRRRLLQHLSDEDNPKLRRQLHMFRDIVQFSAVFTTGERETLELERTLIRDWQPETNRYKFKSHDG